MDLYTRLTQLDAWQCEQFDPRIRYVVPCEPENSYIMHKIEGGPYCLLAPDMPSQPMPMGKVLDQAAIDTLAALFQYGLREVAWFLAVLLPFAAALSAVLMAIAILCRTVKEAQASAGVVVLVVSLMPLFSIFNLGGEARWHLWLPGLSQNLLMTRVLKGEGVDAEQVLVPIAVCAVLTVAALAFVTRRLRDAAVR